jgi:hypothetical protein
MPWVSRFSAFMSTSIAPARKSIRPDSGNSPELTQRRNPAKEKASAGIRRSSSTMTAWA